MRRLQGIWCRRSGSSPARPLSVRRGGLTAVRRWMPVGLLRDAGVVVQLDAVRWFRLGGAFAEQDEEDADGKQKDADGKDQQGGAEGVGEFDAEVHLDVGGGLAVGVHDDYVVRSVCDR